VPSWNVDDRRRAYRSTRSARPPLGRWVRRRSALGAGHNVP